MATAVNDLTIIFGNECLLSCRCSPLRSSASACFSDATPFCINSPDFFLLCLLSCLIGWVRFFPSWFPAALGAFIIFKNGGRNAKKEAEVGESEGRVSCNGASPPPMTSAEWGICWDPEKGPIMQSPQERSHSGVKLEVFGERFEGERHGHTSQWTSERWGRGSPDTRHPPPTASRIPSPWLWRKDEVSVWNAWLRRWRMGRHWWGRGEGYPALILDGLITGKQPGHGRHCCHALTTSSTTVWVTGFEGCQPGCFISKELCFTWSRGTVLCFQSIRIDGSTVCTFRSNLPFSPLLGCRSV